MGVGRFVGFPWGQGTEQACLAPHLAFTGVLGSFPNMPEHQASQGVRFPRGAPAESADPGALALPDDSVGLSRVTLYTWPHTLQVTLSK